jgi:penicillin amidase
MRMLRRVGWSGVALVVLVLGALVVYRFAGMPQSTGVLTVPGPAAAIRVVRESNGIPHVFAASDRDAYFAIGLLHAQDRLWQLEMNRRIVAGRLAEVLGPAALDTDRFLRALGVRRNAQRVLAALDAPTRAALQAYADGVNAGIELTRAQPWKLSPEFLILGVRPEPWSPVDSIGWSTMMAWDLSGNHATELLRLALSRRLSAQQMAQLMETDPPLALPDLGALYAGLDPAPALALLERLPPGNIDGIGSNNWVLDGRRTVSGKPLLANDPHLALAAPALWYFAHLSAPGLDVIGATLPGLPAVVLGRNQRIAWGFTNTGPDSQDLYLERLVPGDPGRYRTPDGAAAFATRQETIHVKGAPDVQLTVRETRHGPVISDVFASAADALRGGRVGDDTVLAFRWSALAEDDGTIRAGLALNRAGNWAEFLAALRDFHAPQQNMVYADIDGNIGFVAPGRVPVRDAANDLRGLAPAPGWNARYDWKGFVPFDELPRSYRPADGMIVTANQRIVPDDYPHFISAEWTLPLRHDRIRFLLTRKERHDSASFAAVQADTHSAAVEDLLPVLRLARPASDLARSALGLLGQWGGDMRADAPEPLIATAWIDRIRRLVFEDEVGPALFPQFDRQRVRLRALTRALTRPDHAIWCDVVGTPAVETCGELVDRALEESVQDLARRFGTDPTAWRWGDAHQAVSEHRPFSKVAPLAKFFEIRVPSAGDTQTVNVGRNNPWNPADPFTNRWAASLRAIYDLADPDASRFMHSTGQSGHVLSPHYRDMAQAWARVEYVPMITSPQAIERAAYATLRIEPAPR